MTLGERIHEARLAQRLTVAGLAGASGLTKGFISQVESGRSNPSIASLCRIAAALQLDPSELVAGSAPKSETLLTSVVTCPELHRAPKPQENTSVLRVTEGELGTFYQVHLAPGAALIGASKNTPNRSGATSQALCTVLQGSVVFSGDGIDQEVGETDVLTWNASSGYELTNSGYAPALLLLVYDRNSPPPKLVEGREQVGVGPRTLVPAGDSDRGPLRLVVMREQQRQNRRERR